MTFTSVYFVVFFVLVIACYYCLDTKPQNRLLLAASYVFYGFWDWRFLALLIGSTVVDYVASHKIQSSHSRNARRFWLTTSCLFNLGALAFFKYFDFFIDSTTRFLSWFGLQADLPVLAIILPVGISFYTFQTLSYTIDVYNNELAPERDFLTFALYVSYFPQLVAGPIERAKRLLPQLRSTRTVTTRDLSVGISLIGLGYFKKLAIADVVAPAVNAAFFHPDSHNSAVLLAGLYLFSFQIYCDFSAYSDIARGCSRLLGIELMRNFEWPYLSRNITEFWRRWHVSLSTWLRDYVYIPLGGKGDSHLFTARNLITTMLLGGLWHGASWTFVAWGGLHGSCLAFHKCVLTRPTQSHQKKQGRYSPLLFVADCAAVILTFHIVTFGWLLFRSPDFSTVSQYLSGIASGTGNTSAWILALLPVAMYGGLIFFLDIIQWQNNDETVMLDWPWAWRGVVWGVMLTILVMGIGSSEAADFIYFQF
ncbi:MBOAT family O-acyltransferase [Symmachiella dynata]|uniref:MBOAT family O-acyltransferase n=1 Tax=Symmachiella dynata TaxID=2527995 RepID=UPI0030EEA513|tara:strand:- start:722 stop:2158 length:1437 start_codon:yes stop_codon:yes gene_type:complete